MFDALALSILTTGGFAIIVGKFPPKLRHYIVKYELFTEIVTIVLAYVILGGTLTALFASAMVGLQVSALLYIAKHPEKFEYLGDIRDAVGEALDFMNRKVEEIATAYSDWKACRAPQYTA